MSYVTYTTEALVCGSFEQNTADKSFLLFTRENGMLFANAKSVREEVSKQRMALGDFSRIRVSLVKGKTGWRIGSVESMKNDFSEAKDRQTRGSVVLLYRLLRRFIRGEEASAALYDFVLEGLDMSHLPHANRQLFDLYLEIKLLLLLGYVAEEALPKTLLTHTLQTIGQVEDASMVAKLEILVAKATENSHL
jgi:recombinational DNA repair protein (RecF pathway)